MPIRQIVSKVTPRGWVMIGASAAVALVFIYLLFSMASAPSYSTLMTGLDPAQTGKITSTLDTKGISYQLQNNGTALAVQSDKTAQARVALATAGLLSNQQPGFSLFDKQQLGASNFQQQITYQRALEGQLAQTIQSIDGISSAQVQLVLPNAQDQLFSDNSQPATAAVLLSGTTSVDPGSVKGIAQLVASSVPSLKPDKVTITDATGQLLWPTADSLGSGGTSLLAKQNAQARYDASTAASVESMLTQILGPNKAQVEVNADLDVNQSTSDVLTYSGQGKPLTQQTQTETLRGGGGTGGTAGAAGNIPGYAQTGGGGNSNYSNKTSNTTFGVNKTVTHLVNAPGKVNRQGVSVLVDSSVPAGQIPALRAAITNAVGLDAKRGDTLSIGQMAFAKPAATATKKPVNMIGYAKYAVVAVLSLLFLGFVARLLKRRENETFMSGQPTWLRELESPRPLAALETAEQAPTQVVQLNSPVNVAKRQIEDLVERDPDRVAQQVRAWMTED